MEIENLINNLNRAADDWEEKHPVTYTGNLRVQDALRDAATALSTLRAENEQLRGELEYEQEHANAYHEERGQWEAENEKLRAELERVKVERDAYQAYFKDLSSKPDCNTCEKRNCDYRPKVGATVRANCPLYSGPEKED